ncbi:ParA family protein [Anaerolineales bacterium HSG6]|nr:ParA family protein [Anaerolineales bacterium HSG6]MDM8532954.1 ParA family protein [Anaerolineales bacterium HSG25]
MSQAPTIIYSIANQKGGVGKTTTAVNLAALVSAQNKRVLIIDSDPQANATSSLGVKLPENGLTLYDVLVNKHPLDEVIQPTYRPQLFIVPSSPDLAAAEVEMVRFLARELVLKKAIEAISTKFDFIFIDTPPSLGVLTINALTAARHGVIIPVQSEYLALEGLGHLLNTIRLIRDNLNAHLQIAGVLMTMFDSRTKLATQVVNEVRIYFPEETFETVVPRNIRLSEAPSHGEDILTYAPNSPGSMSYQAVTKELLKRSEKF